MIGIDLRFDFGYQLIHFRVGIAFAIDIVDIRTSTHKQVVDVSLDSSAGCSILGIPTGQAFTLVIIIDVIV